MTSTPQTQTRQGLPEGIFSPRTFQPRTTHEGAIATIIVLFVLNTLVLTIIFGIKKALRKTK